MVSRMVPFLSKVLSSIFPPQIASMTDLGNISALWFNQESIKTVLRRKKHTLYGWQILKPQYIRSNEKEKKLKHLSAFDHMEIMERNEVIWALVDHEGWSQHLTACCVHSFMRPASGATSWRCCGVPRSGCSEGWTKRFMCCLLSRERGGRGGEQNIQIQRKTLDLWVMQGI